MSNHNTLFKGDPSDLIQHLPTLNLKILCCRYWWLTHWEFAELSFPFWRIYHNEEAGATIFYQGNKLSLKKNHLYIIPPNTSFSSQLFNHQIQKQTNTLVGGRISKQFYQNMHSIPNHVKHMFVHFTLGYPHDFGKQGIYELQADNTKQVHIGFIKSSLETDPTHFSTHTLIHLQSFIAGLLAELPSKIWSEKVKDERIHKLLKHVENHPGAPLSNDVLASQVNMATNAFIRLFRRTMGISPQVYVKKIRIDKACVLLQHGLNSIEEIASNTGFADRFYFSRVFKEITGCSPASYRKTFTMK